MKKALIFLSVVFFLAFISAVEWPLDKTGTCNLFNLTNGSVCDTYWCNSIQGGTYNTTREICVFTVNVNVTMVVNMTTNGTNQTLNSSQFWNTTQIQEYVLNQTLFMRDAILETNENRTRLLTQEEISKSGTSGTTGSFSRGPSDSVYYIGIVAFVILVGSLAYMRSKTPETKSQARAFQRGNLPQQPGRFVGQDEGTKKLPVSEPTNPDEV